MLLRALKPYLFFSGALFKKLVNFCTQCFKRGGKVAAFPTLFASEEKLLNEGNMASKIHPA